MYRFPKYPLPVVPNPPPFGRTIAPVVVDVDGVALMRLSVELLVSGPDIERPVRVPSDVMPGWEAFTERRLPERLNPLPIDKRGS